MTPQELKNSILQLALQGKLVEQRPEEGTAAELVEKILAAKNAKSAKKNLTRSRGARGAGEGMRGLSHLPKAALTLHGTHSATSAPPREKIPDDEKPFDIPESWEWVRLGEVCTIARGGSPRPIKDYITTAADGINWIKIGDTEKDGKYICSTAEKIKPSGVSKSRMVHAGDFLLTNSMSFGRPYILKVNGCIHDGWLVISQGEEIFDQDYLYWVLSSGYAYSQFCAKVSGAVVKNLNSDKVANSVFPLPPLAEQKRIVAKLEELLPLIDRYEKAWSKLEDFNKRFPVDMQKSLLQMAIQGKLVDHRPEEGTGEELYRQIQAEKQRLVKSGKIKKEKPLPEITEDEIPFEIPDSWKWVRLSNVVDVRDGTHDTPKYVSEGVPLVTSKNLVNGTIDFATAKHISHEDSEAINIRSGVDDGDILFAMIGTIGNPVLIRKDREFSIKNMALFKPINRCLFCMEYLMQFLVKAQVDMRKSASASVQSFVSLSFLRNYLFPLPPLAEQRRIVAKLEEILPLCERLK